MILKDARCTNCGASLKLEPQKTLSECEYCHTTILVSSAVELALVEVDKTKDILKYRSLLRDAVSKNSIDEILRVSSLIKDIIPDDFSANYFFAYGKQLRNEPSFMKAFLSGPSNGTPEDIKSVVPHIIQRSDLRDKKIILKFLENTSPESVESYEVSHQDRVRQEDQYANVMRDVFICHSSDDKEVAEAIVSTLEKEGFTCWISTRNLRPEDSESYWDNIEKAIIKTKLFIVVSSESAMLSKDVQREVQYSINREQPRFEYKIDRVPQTILFKQSFDGIKWVDGTENPLKQANKLPKRVYEELNDSVQENPSKKSIDVVAGSKSFNLKKIIIPLVSIIILGTTGIILAMSGVFNLTVYTVTFEDYNGVVIETMTEESGATILYPSNPSREGHTFTGWSSNPETITADSLITAKYERLEYTVTYVDHLDNVIKTETVFYGESSTPPSYEREGYVLSGWSDDFQKVVQDLTLRPIFEDQTISITFEDYDGSVLKIFSGAKGTAVEFPSNPSREGHTFTGWSSNPETITADLTITAKYVVNTYEVVIKNEKGSVIESQFVEYGVLLENALINNFDIEGYTFTGWDLTSHETMPNENIEIKAFFVLNGLEFNFYINNSQILGYKGGLKSIEFPDKIENKSVNLINGFYRKQLISITLPAALETIGNSAFQENQLTSITIPESVKRIGAGAFQGNQLTSITIPKSVTIIGAGAFKDNQLMSVNMLNEITELSDEVFRNNQLSSIVIPDSIISIGARAFQGNQLTTLEIPAGVISIGRSAFSSNKLISINIPNALTAIAGYTFAYNQLTNLNIPGSVISIGEHAFRDNELTELVIPNSVVAIDRHAFMNNQLETIVIPESVISVGDGAFMNNQLKSITILKGVTSIGWQAFYNNQLKSITIPESVISIGVGAFMNNQLTSVTIPESVTSIGQNAFSNNQLTSISILGDNTRFNDIWEDIGFPADLKPD